MTDPDFVAQTAEPMTADERREWFKVHYAEFREKGATWGQMAVDDTYDPMILLCEGWIVRPNVQPEPHFQMTYVQAKP